MKNYMIIGLLLIIGILVIMFTKQKHDSKLDYYSILCGVENSDTETQYISVKKEGRKYLVQGKFREFPGCRVEKHMVKANKIEKIAN